MVAPRCRKLRFWSAIALALLAVQAHAAQVLDVEVTRNGGNFLIGMHVTIDAPPPAVFRALQDYAAMMRYNPDLRAVHVQSTGVQGRVRLATVVHTCVLIFCKTMHQEEIMTATAGADGGTLDSVFVAHSGDFKEGHGLWIVRACAQDRTKTCMDVRIDLVPAFWVAPVIGPWAIRRTMVAEAEHTGAGLEAMARR